MADDQAGAASEQAPDGAAGDTEVLSTEERDRRARDRLELVATIVLSIATVLTAWSAFEAAKWGGVQTLQLNDATAKRAESVKADTAGGQKEAVDVAFFNNWITAIAEGNEELADYHQARFSDELTVAFEEWVQLDLEAADAPESPIEMDEYEIPEYVEGEELLAEGDALAAQARESNQRSDNYVLLTVLFAAVLFFAGISGKFSSVRAQRIMVVMASVLLVVGAAFLVTFPVEI